MTHSPFIKESKVTLTIPEGSFIIKEIDPPTGWIDLKSLNCLKILGPTQSAK